MHGRVLASPQDDDLVAIFSFLFWGSLQEAQSNKSTPCLAH